MENVITKKLESLSPEQQEWILDIAAHSSRLADVIKPLRQHGIEVSLSTLTRFVREHRERVLLADGDGMKDAVETLATRGQGENFRKGTLEAIRQRFYEEAIANKSTAEETRKVYAELLKEEAKLKELQLEERRMAVLEEQTRLQKVKLRLAARAQRGRKVVKLDQADVVQNAEVADVEAAAANGRPKAIKDRTSKSEHESLQSGEKVKALVGVVSKLEDILNRGGSVAEKVEEARGVLAEEQKLLEGAKAMEVGNGGD
jgi:hypothetical protein